MDFYWELKVKVGKKYDPSQPRVPAGSSEGGQWTEVGGSDLTIWEPSAKVTEHAKSEGSESIQRFAKDVSITEEQAREVIYGKLKSDLENPVAIGRGFVSSLNILDEGRFKTQFETGTSGGVYDRKFRSEAEKNGLGVPPSMRGETGRPVYGLLDAPDSNTFMYGDVLWVLKDNVKNRATFTLGDSLYEFATGRLVGAPFSDPHDGALDRNAGRYGKSGVKIIEYIEAQIQGGVTLADVSKIVINVNADPGWYQILKTRAEEKGIPVEVRDEG
jgi:hypothetical protein